MSPSHSMSVMPRTAKSPLERLQERIRTADRGWFFAAVAEKVADQRQAKGFSQRELAEIVGTTQSALDCDLVVDLKPRKT
jgi:ribosome-binding protein aMBF1 (putative translation factor)